MPDTAQQTETLIRDVWPSVARFPAIARFGQLLTNSIILAPLAWLLMAPLYFMKVLPIFGRRYRLTNKSVSICLGATAKQSQHVALGDIDEVRVKTDGNSTFFRAGDLEIVTAGNVVLTLPGVPTPEGFRIAILNACSAWAPGRASKLNPFIAAAKS